MKVQTKYIHDEKTPFEIILETLRAKTCQDPANQKELPSLIVTFRRDGQGLTYCLNGDIQIGSEELLDIIDREQA